MAGDPVEGLLAEVPERRMPQIVRERRGLGDVRIAAAQFRGEFGGIAARVDPLGDGARDLRDLEAVREPVVKQPGTMRR